MTNRHKEGLLYYMRALDEFGDNAIACVQLKSIRNLDAYNCIITNLGVEFPARLEWLFETRCELILSIKGI